MNAVRDFARFKSEQRKISMVTAYDAWSARLVARSSVDAMLVGDSVAMVVHGQSTTLGATVDMMATHTRAVASAAQGKFVITDLPFLSHRKGITAAVDAVAALVTSGAHAVKIEGVDGHEDVIGHIIESGVPVMGHIGLTPQAFHALSGFTVQGRNSQDAERLLRQARTLAQLGCFAIVLECVPCELAAKITADVQPPTIGIGAGAATDGQVLVLHDLLGLTDGKSPRFVRRYCDADRIINAALNGYDADVKQHRFPGVSESYS